MLFISKSSRKDAIKIAIENRIESINTENSIVKDIQIEALKPEIISVERMEYLVFVQK